MIPALTKLVNEFSKLPGIGKKTAERLSFYILNMTKNEAESLANSIVEVKKKIQFCIICNNITEQEKCDICSNSEREQSLVCIVESIQDLIAIEKAKEYKGVFHILMGTLSPLEGIGVKELKIDSLISKIKEKKVKEIIIATNPNTKGEITATYLTNLIKPYGIKITRIARGIPVGGEIEYIDPLTITKSLENRIEI